MSETENQTQDADKVGSADLLGFKVTRKVRVIHRRFKRSKGRFFVIQVRYMRLFKWVDASIDYNYGVNQFETIQDACHCIDLQFGLPDKIESLA